MKKTTLYFASILLAFLSFSCGSDTKDENKEMRDAVIAVHDEVMPKMGQLKAYEKEAQKRAEELLTQTPVDSAKVKELSTLSAELGEAYEGMFVWMRQYEVKDEDKSPEEIKAYLDEQMVLVREVNEKIKKSMEKAETLLKD